jgi:hypothetical protein
MKGAVMRINRQFQGVDGFLIGGKLWVRLGEFTLRRKRILQ